MVAIYEHFLRLSGLLDARGTGVLLKLPTHVPPCRCPLDHVFHSGHFRLISLRRMRRIGSDHFPMFVELSYEPDGGRSGR